MDLSKLHVICTIANPIRYASRYRLYKKFRRHMIECGVNFWTVEVAFGHRPFHITHPNQPCNLQLRTHNELWFKEQSLNALVNELPLDWQYVAWVDADIEFQRWRGPHAWYRETVHQLQHHKVVQLFQTAIDLGPNGEALQVHEGFVHRYLRGLSCDAPYLRGHPGYAWAMRRDAWDEMGGLFDRAILGAGDNHMASAWIGKVEDSVNKNVSPAYMKHLLAYQEQCERYIRRNIGYVRGTIQHEWHGRKRDRGYADRWKILVDNQFDPDTDLKRDWQGLYQLADHGDLRSMKLRDDIRRYFRSRNEDSIDLE